MLKKYQKKRKFSKTQEPKGKVKEIKNKRKIRIFVIQEHKSKKLHWDLRLEDGGVLRSWAVTKKPSTSPSIKRLAIKVEAHPIEYAKFKGKIPEGQYGAGTVKIWDKGRYILESKKPKKWVVKLKGNKLKGRFALIKTNYAKNSWLFFKLKG
jgi:DNA ligase D-like protein (predicted 3'-phosphoesterase)